MTCELITSFSATPSRLDRLTLILLLLFLLLMQFRIERMFGIISYSLHNTQTFRPSLTEKNAITNSKILRALDKSESDLSAVTGANVLAINVDDGAGLRDGSHVEHGLVFCFDGGCVGENEDFGNELAVDFGVGQNAGCGVGFVGFVEDDHAFADVFSADVAESETG